MSGELQRPARVLIVDDESSSRYILRRLLQKAAVEVQVAEATSAEDGLAQIEEAGEPLLVLLDVNMPLVNGFEFLERLDSALARGAVPKDRARVAVLTSSTNPADIARARSHATVIGVVEKYPTKEELARLVCG